jgi:hypothetical protein
VTRIPRFYFLGRKLPIPRNTGHRIGPESVQKYFEKSEKKACQPFESSINGKVRVTNRPHQAFKNILKKVKKKLVSL